MVTRDLVPAFDEVRGIDDARSVADWRKKDLSQLTMRSTKSITGLIRSKREVLDYNRLENR